MLTSRQAGPKHPKKSSPGPGAPQLGTRSVTPGPSGPLPPSPSVSCQETWPKDNLLKLSKAHPSEAVEEFNGAPLFPASSLPNPQAASGAETGLSRPSSSTRQLGRVAGRPSVSTGSLACPPTSFGCNPAPQGVPSPNRGRQPWPESLGKGTEAKRSPPGPSSGPCPFLSLSLSQRRALLPASVGAKSLWRQRSWAGLRVQLRELRGEVDEVVQGPRVVGIGHGWTVLSPSLFLPQEKKERREESHQGP